jgi:hypothetical protein
MVTGSTTAAAAAAPQYLAAGGLLILLKPNTPDIFVFDVSDADKSVYKYGLTSSMGACPDEFVAARSGGFYASNMCSRTGERNWPRAELALKSSQCVACQRAAVKVTTIVATF